MAFGATERAIKQLKEPPQEIRTPISQDMFLPNHSGVSTHPEFLNYLQNNYAQLADLVVENIFTANASETQNDLLDEVVDTQAISDLRTGDVLEITANCASGDAPFDAFNLYLYDQDDNLLAFLPGGDGYCYAKIEITSDPELNGKILVQAYTAIGIITTSITPATYSFNGGFNLKLHAEWVVTAGGEFTGSWRWSASKLKFGDLAA